MLVAGEIITGLEVVVTYRSLLHLPSPVLRDLANAIASYGFDHVLAVGNHDGDIFSLPYPSSLALSLQRSTGA